MKEQQLAEYVQQSNQTNAAGLMGVNQGTISKMLSAGRDIRLVFDGDTFSHYYEVRVGKSRAA